MPFFQGFFYRNAIKIAAANKKEAEERKKAEDKKRDDEYLALQKKLRVDLPKQFTQEEIDNIKNSKSVKKRLDEEETAAKLAQLCS